MHIRNICYMSKQAYDVIFVGAGVANSCAAYFLHKLNPKINFLLIDMGKNVTRRDRDKPKDCATGILGAGIFSDGKFSFYPSSTHVWKLEQNKLRKSYSFLEQIFEGYLKIPKFPEELEEDFKSAEDWKLKTYETQYLSLQKRIELAKKITIDFYKEPNARFVLNTAVDSIEKITQNESNEKSLYKLNCTNVNNEQQSFLTKKLVIGGGRFSSLSLRSFVPSVFKRIELGARFEGPSDSKLFNKSTNIDPKFMKYDQQNDIEYRTFCWCRSGEVCQTKFNDIVTWSGRSDCEETKRSNFGFNVRFKNEKYMKLFNFEKKLYTKSFELNFVDVINNRSILGEYYGEFTDYLLDGLESFLKFNNMDKEALNDFKIIGPTIEGVGYYPETDNNLKVSNENIWITGDATGKFRGIIGSMLSGIYVGHQL